MTPSQRKFKSLNREMSRYARKAGYMTEKDILEGLNSGKASEVTPAFWAKKHQQLKQKISQHRPLKCKIC